VRLVVRLQLERREEGADPSSGQVVQAARVEHEVEGRRCLVVDDVALDKLDLDAGLLGARPGRGEGGRNEVDPDDGEALLREYTA
jgi:hypothetical protein